MISDCGQGFLTTMSTTDARKLKLIVKKLDNARPYIVIINSDKDKTEAYMHYQSRSYQ